MVLESITLVETLALDEVALSGYLIMFYAALILNESKCKYDKRSQPMFPYLPIYCLKLFSKISFSIFDHWSLHCVAARTIAPILKMIKTVMDGSQKKRVHVGGGLYLRPYRQGYGLYR